MSCSPSGNVVDAFAGLPFSQAAPQIAFEAGGGLVALLGCLGEQLHDDCRDKRSGLPSHRSPASTGCRRDVAVHPFHRIGRRERQHAGQHLVQGHAEGVEVAAESIDRFMRPVCSGAM